jgi:carbohydrate-binding DOMON domain-containing protein
MHRRSCTLTALTVFAAASAWATEPPLALLDPEGDDNGPGSYKYPTNPVYTPRSFDLRKLEVSERGDDVEFKVTLGAAIEDPWDSKTWDGNGFSIQFVQVYLDLDHTAGKGFVEPLPGLGSAKFNDDEAWDKVVLISPQGKTRLSAEIRAKAAKFKASIVIPKSTRAAGKTLTAIVKKADLGGMPKGSTGFQAAVQSNEGYPDKADLLTRRVNENAGEHRFGGGNDGDCDPHVLDILAGAGKGERGEVKAQHDALAYTCGSKVARLPMVYPAAAGK